MKLSGSLHQTNIGNKINSSGKDMIDKLTEQPYFDGQKHIASQLNISFAILRLHKGAEAPPNSHFHFQGTELNCQLVTTKNYAIIKNQPMHKPARPV